MKRRKNIYRETREEKRRSGLKKLPPLLSDEIGAGWKKNYKGQDSFLLRLDAEYILDLAEEVIEDGYKCIYLGVIPNSYKFDEASDMPDILIFEPEMKGNRK